MPDNSFQHRYKLLLTRVSCTVSALPVSDSLLLPSVFQDIWSMKNAILSNSFPPSVTGLRIELAVFLMIHNVEACPIHWAE